MQDENWEAVWDAEAAEEAADRERKAEPPPSIDREGNSVSDMGSNLGFDSRYLTNARVETTYCTYWLVSPCATTWYFVPTSTFAQQ